MDKKNKTIWLEYFMVTKGIAGVGVYVKCLLDILHKIPGYNTSTFSSEFCENQNKYIRGILFFIWLNTVFYIKTLIKRPDVIIFPKHFMPFFKVHGVKYIAILHDLSTINNLYNRSKIAVNILRFYNYICVKRADVLVAVSETTKKEIEDYYNYPIGKIKIIYNTIQPIFRQEVEEYNLAKYGIVKSNYLLSIATQNAHKNIPNLINAFNKISKFYPDLKLVLIGKHGNDTSNFNKTNPNIIVTGYIDDKDIPFIYKNALLYIFPSLYEGFGIPILEAQYSGVPVLCSDIPIFHEVANNSAEFVQPNSDAIAEKIDLLLKNQQRLEELTKLGYENIQRFSEFVLKKQIIEAIENMDI